MRTEDDDFLRRDLVKAAGRDLPGPEFEHRVMADVEEDTERRRLLGPVPPSPTRRIVGFAAAVAIVALGAWAVARGYLHRPGKSSKPGISLASPGVRLPSARTANPAPEPIRITVTRPSKTGKISIRLNGSPVAGLAPLRSGLGVLSGVNHGERASERDVVLRIDRQVPWREVQWVMQACAAPEARLYRLYFAVRGPDGPGVVPVFLHTGSSASTVSFIRDPTTGKVIRVVERREKTISADPTRPTVVLERKRGEKATRILLGGDPLGAGEPAFDAAETRFGALAPQHRVLEINAWPNVPYRQIVRIVDLWRVAGGMKVLFVGTALSSDSAKEK